MISVIVPVRDALPELEAQLGALVNQECDEEWEVVVADNGSTDGSLAVARWWAEHHGSVRWTDASAVRGPAAARNAGVRAARGTLLAFCDADDVVRPGWLAGLAEALRTADVVAGFFDLRSLNGAPPSPPVPATLDQFSFLPAGLGANLAVHRPAFEAVGGFAEELRTGEDLDLCWRLQLEGYRFAVAEGAVVAKRDRTGFGELFGQGYAFGRGSVVLYRRHRVNGAGPNLKGAARSWLWLVIRAPLLVRPGRGRNAWARAAGMRVGRLVGSVRGRVFFP